MAATINPILDKVVVQVKKTKGLVQGGIILASNSKKEQPVIAKVIARGQGGMVNGREVKMYVNSGDDVLIPKHAGTEFTLDGKDYVIVSQEEILAIIA